jgi:hypothetical protein
MNSPKCACVFPSATEQELATLPGSEPGTALRIYVEAGAEGYVRLQHLAHDVGTGWYVQKSFILPGEMLKALLPELRKADCLIPKSDGAPQPSRNIPYMRLCQDEHGADEMTAERRGA